MLAGRTKVGNSTASKELVAAADENEFLGLVAGTASGYNPLPAPGEHVEAGEIYGYNDGLVICRQEHTRTANAPIDVPALFAVYRPNPDGATLEWIAGEPVEKGDRRLYNGTEYECIQAHQTEFTPDQTPALWNVVPTSDEWQAGVAYSIGDQVTYNSVLYECIQAHTSQVGWEPPNVPALWSEI